MTRFATLSIY